MKYYREKFLEDEKCNPDRCDFETFCSIILPPEFCLLQSSDYDDALFQQSLTQAQALVEAQARRGRVGMVSTWESEAGSPGKGRASARADKSRSQ